MARLIDMQDTVLQNALVQNPATLYFPWNCSDYPYASYPLGIPRAAVVAAWQSKCDIRMGKGGSFPVMYAPGFINVNAEASNPSAGITATQTSSPFVTGATQRTLQGGPNGAGALLQNPPVLEGGLGNGGTTAGSSQIITTESQVV